MPDQSPELRELKKQTRIMARREAGQWAASGAAMGVIVALVALFEWPGPATLLLPLVLPFATGTAMYWFRMRRLTKD